MSPNRLRTAERLGVFMNGAEVGLLARGQTGAVSFTYDASWLSRPTQLPISRQLPLQEKPHVGRAVTNYLDGLLPDDPAVRERLAAHAGANGVQSFDLMSAVGRDCVGALQFYPDGQSPGPLKAARGTPISERKIGQLLRNLRLNPLGVQPDSDFRISLAGAQSKTALLWLDGKWNLPTGPTATTHILKPSIGQLPEGPDLSLSVENEWLCLRLVHAFGLKAAQAEIVDFDGTRALVVERFDRAWDKRRLVRLPQEDLCQALGFGPHQKYEAEGGPGIRAIMGLLDESDERDRDRRTFMKAQLVFWLIAAIDGHAKNYSVLIRPGGFALTPLYDIVSAEPHVNRRTLPIQRLKLAMAIGDNRHYRVREISGRHFQQTAARVGFAGIEGLLDEVAAQLPEALEHVGNELPRQFPLNVAEAIFGAITDRAAGLNRRL